MKIWCIVALLAFTASAEAQIALFTLEDEVKAEDFVYYKVFHPGNLLLVLESLQGDADIYISDKNPAPTYDPETYDLQASTCGTDSIFVPREFKRPLVVGIYGHFMHNRSKYSLEVWRMPEIENHFAHEWDEMALNNGEITNKDNVAESNRKDSEGGGGKKSTTTVKRKTRSIPNGLWPLLELFEVLFL